MSCCVALRCAALRCVVLCCVVWLTISEFNTFRERPHVSDNRQLIPSWFTLTFLTIFSIYCLFVCFISDFLTDSYFHLHLLRLLQQSYVHDAGLCQSYMCLITPEPAKVGRSYNHMRGPGVGCWFSDRCNCSQWSFETAALPITFTLTSENLSICGAYLTVIKVWYARNMHGEFLGIFNFVCVVFFFIMPNSLISLFGNLTSVHMSTSHVCLCTDNERPIRILCYTTSWSLKRTAVHYNSVKKEHFKTQVMFFRMLKNHRSEHKATMQIYTLHEVKPWET